MAQRARRAAKRAARATARAEARHARSRRKAAAREAADLPLHLSLVRAPEIALRRTAARTMTGAMGREITVATYNVHRWTGFGSRREPDPARAGFVISELGADVLALQEVLRPETGEDPLIGLCDALGLHLAFAVTREHKRGQLGNAILSRFPISSVSVLDISFSRIERRGALAAQSTAEAGSLSVVATHLSLVDRTRRRQVQSLLEHPQLRDGPAILLGDMNAWRRCHATRELDTLTHHNRNWPSSFPSAAPVLALDRIYVRGAELCELYSHDTAASRRASDHLPVVARIDLEKS